MWKSKLLDVFRTLNGTEKRGINKFVRSPFFNQQAGVTALWDYLVKHSNGWSEDFERTKVFRAIYPEKDYKESQIKHTMSDLLECIEEYLIYVEFKNNPTLKGIKLVEIYRKKELTKHYQQALRQTNKDLNKLTIKPAYYDLNFLLEYEKFVFLQNQKRTNANNLQELGDALDAMILVKKLKQSCMFFAHERVYKVDYDYSFLAAILTYLEDSKYLQDPLIGIYYYCYRALTEESDLFFQEFKKLLFQLEDKLSFDELGDLLQLGINYCVKQLNQGIQKYIREAFNLYQLGLKKDLITHDQYITRFAYKNIVALGLNLEEYEWTENFLLDYRDHLNPNYRKGTFNYNRAKWFYTQKKYKEAFAHLQDVDDSDLLLNFGAKVMLLKMYYELQEFEALESLLDSFKALVNRKKVLSYHKMHFSSIIQFTKQLMYLRPEDRGKVESLKKAIGEAKVLAEREWLMEQIKRLEK